MTHYSLEFGGGWAALLLAAAAGAAFFWHARKSPARKALLFLRGAAVFCLAAALLKPALAERRPQKLKPKLLILLDHGHSMQSKAGRGSRLEAAARWLLEHRRAIETRADPVFFALSDRGRKLSGWEALSGLKASNAAFKPADSLRDVMEDGAASAPRAWLLSDGNAEPEPDLAEVLGGLKTPVDVLGVGPSRREKGVNFLDLKTPDFAFLHGRFDVSAEVEAAGLSGKRLTLRLLREDSGGAWAAVEEKTEAVRSDYETFSATFTATAQSLGTERYRLEAGAEEDGAKGRHARQFRVEVIRQKYRIMYLSGRPSAEYANLREFLMSDPNHELVSFVILRNPDNPSTFADNELSLIPFPAQEIFIQNLPQFDLFILENFSYTRFQLPVYYLESLKKFVTGGGALLVIGGENAFGLGGYRGTPLEEMLPVKLASTSPDFVTGLFSAQPAALSHPLVRLYDTPEASKEAWEALPPLDGFARFDSVRPGSTVLAVHPKERTADGSPLPIFAIRPYGRGKVMLVSSDSTWRWRLGAAGDWRIGSFYARFWSKAVQYLTGSLDLSKVKFAPLPDRLPPREPAVFSLRVFDEGFKPAERAATEVSVLWTLPNGSTREVVPQETEPGVFSIELTGLVPGANRLRATARLHGKPWGEDQLRFTWEAAPPEAPMDRKWLKNAAELSGGVMADLSAAELSELTGRLPPVREEAEVQSRSYPCASPFWLGLTAFLFLGEWGLRRWKGFA